MKEETKSNKKENPLKPAWLQRLEEESWQAELALSGAAFFATLQLPELFDWLEAKLLLNFEDFTLSFFDFIVPILFIANLSLPILFVFHLAVRALWIGLVGLNSVYPEGFQPNTRFSKTYQEQFIADYGDIDGYIQKMDRLGSSIFGFGFGFFLAFLNMGIIASVVIIGSSFLNDLPAQLQWTKYIVLFLVVAYLVIATSINLSHHPKIRELPLVKKYQYPVTQWIGKITIPISNRYINTSTNLLSFNNFSIKSFLRSMVLFMAGGFILGIMMGASRKFEYVRADRYHAAAQDSTAIIPFAYQTNEYEKVYVTPVLASMETTQNFAFNCWIPLPDRELEHLNDHCSLPPVNDDLARKERKKAKRQRTFECAYEYISIQINSRIYDDFSLKQEYITNEAGRQFGVRVFIKQPDLQIGENMLTVTTQYPHPDTGEPRIAYIPFYYTPLN